jgi:peptide/nickel transport system permease protein
MVRLVRWLAGALATLLVASFAIQAALSLSPGDPAAQVAAVRHELRLDESLLPRYAHWLGDAVQGRFGRSIVFREQVGPLITNRLATTGFLVAFAALLILVVGVGLGLLGGGVRGAAPAVAGVSGLAVAVPAFVAAQLLIAGFALGLGWFPTTGAGEGLGGRISHLTLPAVALALGWCGYVAQITRAAVREEAGREHVDTALGRGLPALTVFRRHVVRNAALPIVTIAGIASAGLIAGAAVVESAFGISGVGSLLVKAVAAKDYNVVLAVSVLIVLVFIVVTGVIDVLQRALDPRTRTDPAR